MFLVNKSWGYLYTQSVDLANTFTAGLNSSTANINVGPYSFDLTLTAPGGTIYTDNFGPTQGVANTSGPFVFMDRSGDALVFTVSNFTGSSTGPPILLLTSFDTEDLDGANAFNNDGFDITGDFNYSITYDQVNGPADTGVQTFLPGMTPVNHINNSGSFPATTIEGATGAILGSAGNPDGGTLTWTSTSVGGQVWLLRNLSFAVVPEPSRALLLLFGGMVCLFKRNRSLA